MYDLADQLGGALRELCASGDPQASREELFRALLRQVSEPGPLHVAVVEDVHWADEATIDLLRFAGRRLREAAVLFIVTYRDDDLAADDPLRIALGELVRQRSTRRISLTPLSADGVRALASGSGLEAAALTGARVELRLLETAAACPPSAVDEPLACGLLSAESGGLRFRHEIARLAVEQVIAMHRRAAIHGRILAALRSLLDRAGDAADASEHALKLWRASGDRLREGDTTRRLSRIMRHLCRGQEADAAAVTAVAVLEPLTASIAQAYANLASQRMLTGIYEAAIETARRAQSLAGLVGAPAVMSDALNTEAVSTAVLGREWTDLGCPYEAALARLDAPEETALREALSILDDLGAAAAARLARRRLRALGARSIPVGPRSATREDPFGLTRREREVLDLICAGQTNAAIAATLFISAKTVDHHVSAVLAKLGAPNRNAAAAQAARLGLTV